MSLIGGQRGGEGRNARPLDGIRKRAHSGDGGWRWKAGTGGNRARCIDDDDGASETAAVGQTIGRSQKESDSGSIRV